MYNDKVKENIYKWRKEHKDEYNDLMRDHNKKYYEANKERRNAQVLKNYYLKKECRKFMNILL